MLVLFRGAKVIGVEGPLDAFKPGYRHSDADKIGDYQDVNQEQDEEFSIPKADAVVYPGAMMVHVEHASVAGGAVMASFWLEDVAHKTISAPLILRVSQVEAPEDRDLSRIGCHGLDEGPYHHEENKMEAAEQDEHCRVVFCFWQPDKKDICVVDNSNNPGAQNNKDVANEGLGSHGYSAGHSDEIGCFEYSNSSFEFKFLI